MSVPQAYLWSPTGLDIYIASLNITLSRQRFSGPDMIHIRPFWFLGISTSPQPSSNLLTILRQHTLKRFHIGYSRADINAAFEPTNSISVIRNITVVEKIGEPDLHVSRLASSGRSILFALPQYSFVRWYYRLELVLRDRENDRSPFSRCGRHVPTISYSAFYYHGVVLFAFPRPSVFMSPTGVLNAP